MTDHGSNTDPGITSAGSESVSSLSMPSENNGTHQAEEKAAAENSVAASAATAESAACTEEAPSTEALDEKKSSPQSHESGFWGLVQSLAITIIIALFIITFVVQAFQIPSQSMENTLLVGDYLLVDKARYGPSSMWSWLLPYQKIRRGDVIVFRYPIDPEKHFVKRVVAIPGDHIHLRDGQLYVNGNLQVEPFAVHKMPFPDSYRDDFPNGNNYRSDVYPRWWHDMPDYMEHGELVVPQDCYFAMGDNRDDSLDSRYWGFVPDKNIVGKAFFVWMNLGNLRRIGSIH